MAESHKNGEALAAATAQYGLCVQQAEALVERRAQLNRFYVTVNTAILAAIGFLLGPEGAALRDFVIVLPIAALVLCLTWRAVLVSHARLLRIKFEVIHTMEAELPFQPYKDEWAIGTDERKKLRLGSFERRLPTVFMLVYFALVLTLVSAAAWLSSALVWFHSLLP